MRRSLLLAASALALSLCSPAYAAEPDKNNADAYKLLDLFGDVFERVRSDYVEPVSDSQLIEAAINGMLQSLDPHSVYFNDKAFKDMQIQTKGEFGGLGLEVSQESGVVKVVTAIDDTPAQRAGLQPNDYITHLDGESVVGLNLNEAVDRMRGPPNTKIRLTIRREGVDAFDVTLTRAVISINPVKYHAEGNVAYIRISQFTEKTDANLKKAIADLKKQIGPGLAGYVLDLRNNPGGLLDQAIDVSADFLDHGEIVSTRARRPEDTQRFNAHSGDITDGLPVVVLINDGSASASEIVAGALQDHHRAILLGTKSFGKGSVQTVIPLPGHGAIKLTTARYYTPSGRSIQQVGIEPDITVPLARIEPLGVEHERRSEASLPHSLKNPDAKGPDGKAPDAKAPDGKAPDAKAPDAKDNGPEQGQKDSAAKDKAAPDKAPALKPTNSKAKANKDEDGEDQPVIKMGDPASDYQLSRALDLLRGLSLYRGQPKAN